MAGASTKPADDLVCAGRGFVVVFKTAVTAAVEVYGLVEVETRRGQAVWRCGGRAEQHLFIGWRWW
jgi:hypothetical protein